MSMQAWVTFDDEGREVLVREGTGVVTAVVAVGDPEQPAVVYRLEIECDRPVARARAIRYSVHGLVESDTPLVVAAIQAERDAVHVQWSIRWERHPWVPDHLPMASLDLATDARATVVSLATLAREVPVGATAEEGDAR